MQAIKQVLNQYAIPYEDKGSRVVFNLKANDVNCKSLFKSGLINPFFEGKNVTLEISY